MPVSRFVVPPTTHARTEPRFGKTSVHSTSAHRHASEDRFFRRDPNENGLLDATFWTSSRSSRHFVTSGDVPTRSLTVSVTNR